MVSVFGRLTQEQYSLIGEIMVHWSAADFQLVNIIARLAGTPDFLGLAILERTNFGQRLDAMERLLDLHDQRYHRRRLSEEVYLSAQAAFKRVSKLRNARNDAAHALLLRMSDESIYAFKPQGRQAGSKPEPPLQNRILGNVKNDDLRRLANELAEIVEMLEALVSLLPEVSEAPEQRSVP